jgi:antitoxin component of MazEF toxin-antitoxin module
MKQHTSSYTSYEVITQKDDNDDLLIPIPPELMKALDWKDGDNVEINIDDKGDIVFSKANR